MNQNKSHFYEDDEINLKELIMSLWSSKLIITCITTIFAIVSVLWALATPNQYQSSSLLKVVDDGQSQSSAGISLPSSILGLDLGAAAGSGKAGLIIATVESRDFFRSLLEYNEIKSTLLAFKEYDSELNEIIYDTSIYDKDNKTFTGNTLTTPSFEKSYSRYRNILSIYLTKRGFIKLDATHQSPEFAFQFITTIIDEINSTSRAAAIKDTEASLSYLYEKLTDTKKIEIKNSINQIITSKLKLQMMAQVIDKYSLDPIDTPFVPEMKVSPNRARISILGTILGFIMGILYTIIRHFGFPKSTSSE